MRTTSGRQRVDVIYRRIDDAFLDPLAFRQDSLLGVPGLLVGVPRRQRRARQRHRHRRRRRQVDLPVRARDDPLLPRRGADPAQRADLAVQRSRRSANLCLDKLDELVVKEVQGSGGYGMLIGPAAKKAEIEAVPRAHQGEPGQLHRAADAVALHLPDLRRAAASRRATSTCGRTCSPARK